SKLFRKNLFGETHPYGKELEELEVQDLTRIQLTGHRDEFMQDVVVFASGKLDDKVQQLLIDEFSSWKTRPVAPKGITAGDHKLFHEYTEKEGSVQSSVRIGKKSLQRTHADYVEVLLLSHILGGYFGSRLMKNIREEKGLTYGIHASIHALQQDSYMLIGADVNKENVTVTFDEVRKELKRLRTEKIADDELEIARNHFIGSLQSELTTPFAHADKIRTIKLFGLPENYYQIMISKLDRTTSEDLIQIGEKHFHEESFSDAAVG
ncbi:MAG: M16 family metallopeptidase, partial [Bacteroidota bacterium]